MKDFYLLAVEVGRRLFARERIVAFVKSLSAPLEMHPEVKVDIRLAQLGDISKLKERFSIRGMKEMLRDGHLCFIADMEGQILHFKWVAFNEAYVSELDRKVHLDASSAYIYASYTVPEYRGLGLDPAVTAEVFDYSREKGIERVYILVRHNNLPELSVMRKAGYRAMGEIKFTQVLGLKKYTCDAASEEDCSKIKEMLLLE